MKTWKECVDEAGVRPYTERPQLEVTYVGYKDGKVIPCKTLIEAKKYRMNDSVASPESLKLRENFDKANKKASQNANDIYRNALREEYSYLSDAVYDLCYSKAYDDGHSGGYDEVTNCMIDITDFAEKIVAAK
jgi:hypothetical protein